MARYIAIYISFAFVLAFQRSNAQANLIPNADFEEYYDCEYNLSTDDIKKVLPHWTMRGSRPARYFNMDCINDPNSDYYNLTSLFQPQSGKGYIAHSYYLLGTLSSQAFRNYSQVQLIQPLEQGKDYYLKYYLMPSFVGSPNISHHGVYFSDTFIIDTPMLNVLFDPILLDPQLELDTLFTGPPGTWKELSYCFTADSTYSVMTFGIFADPDEVTIEFPDGVEFTSYDNFYLAEIDPNLTYDFIEGNDTICAGECVTLSTNHSLIDGTWLWNLPGSDLGSSTDSVVTVCYDAPGVYDVGIWVEHCTGEYQNHFPQAITVLEGISHQPAWTDTTVCPGTAVAVDLTGNAHSVLWSDGSTEKFRLLSQEGNYTYTLSNGFCEQTFVVDLSYTHPVLYETITETDCPGGVFTFLGHDYSTPGTYQDTLTDTEGCDSIIYQIDYGHFVPTPIAIEGPQGFCSGDSIVLQLTSGHTGVDWGNGSTGNNITISAGGELTVIATDTNGCMDTTAISIEEWPVPTVATEDLLDTFFKVGMPLPVQYFGEISAYVWSPEGPLDCGACPFPAMQLPQEGAYTVSVSNVHGCTAAGTVSVSFKASDVYVPNAIGNEPNAWLNGVLFPQSNNDFFYSLKVFDRWGGLLYEADGLSANDPSQGWRPDGKVDQGVYTWMILFEDSGKKRVLAGDVTVL